MLFTFIIPIYNSLTEVTSLLEKISSLTKELDCEVLIVDDCSHDGTYELLATGINGRQNVKLFRAPANSGPGNARNIGLSMALGKYIVFIDSDDELNFIDNIGTNPEFLTLHNHEAIDVICMECNNPARMNDPKSTLPLISDMDGGSNVRSNISYENFPAKECWGVIFSADFLKVNKIVFPCLMLAEDQLFMVRVRLKLRSIARTRLFSYTHTGSSSGLATRFEKRGLSDYSEIIQIVINIANTESGSNLDFLVVKLREMLEIFFWFSIAFYKDNSRKEINMVFNIINDTNSVLELKKISPFTSLKELVSFRQLIFDFIKTKSGGLDLYCLSNIAMSVACISERLKVPVINIVDDARVKQAQVGSLKFGGQLQDLSSYDKGDFKANHTVLICHYNKGVVRNIFLKLRDKLGVDPKQIFALSDFNSSPYLVK
ncbi:MAG: glycosyltransferase [Nitrospina sp.]|jgi:glycosyltransferase involved in cell wall biosynthesis|nr:glycosyltransferase [Nitrospina sp.]MBT5633858.1 glycosyltransferase [Nitrospina sp.]